MKTWSTKIFAISPITGELKEYCGPNVKAPSKELARAYCDHSGIGYGYCHIGDELIAEIPCKKGGYDPDLDNIEWFNQFEN